MLTVARVSHNNTVNVCLSVSGCLVGGMLWSGYFLCVQGDSFEVLFTLDVECTLFGSSSKNWSHNSKP